jgi:hypothetical protein
MTDDLKTQLLSQVVAGPNGCWLWVGRLNGSGYGYLQFDGQTLATHRTSYEVHKGPIPKGLLVRHSCHVRHCINPAHLSVGTTQDNVDDKVANGRHAHGERFGHAVLTEDQVLQIHEMAHDCIYTQREIGEMFGVGQAIISRIKSEKKWRHLWRRPQWSTPIIEEIKTLGRRQFT